MSEPQEVNLIDSRARDQVTGWEKEAAKLQEQYDKSREQTEELRWSLARVRQFVAALQKALAESPGVAE
jgi:septal ring factor EnvC (AmiA/AmiB activator)